MPLTWTTFQICGANRDNFFDLGCLSLDLRQRTYAILQFNSEFLTRQPYGRHLISLKNEVWTSC